MRAISVNANPAPAAAYTKNIDAFDKRCSKSGVSRRVVHMILGATTGAYVALFAYHAAHHWLGVPSRLQPTQHGVVSIILTFYGRRRRAVRSARRSGSTTAATRAIAA